MERELVLRLASLLWRLRRAATERTGLYDIQADHLSGLWRFNPVRPTPHLFVYALFERRTLAVIDEVSTSAERFGKRTVDFARCFLRLSNLPNYAFDRLSRYEATLWRQVAQIVMALDALDRSKPQDGRHSHTMATAKAGGGTVNPAIAMELNCCPKRAATMTRPESPQFGGL